MVDQIRWTIRPYAGLGPLAFGMTRQQVASLLDTSYPVSAVDTVFDGSVNEFRTMNCPVCNYMDGALHAIDTHSGVTSVFLNDIDVYATDSKTLLQSFEQADGGAKTDLGMVIFERLGVNTSGFYRPEEGSFVDSADPDYQRRGVGVFSRGAFDTLLPDFKPISFF